MNEQTLRLILLVEDNPLDARIAEDALKSCSKESKLIVLMDGQEAIDFLHRVGTHVGAPRPDLILLDLNLPGKDGREVLMEIKSDANLRRIPVVVLSTSKAEEDVLNAYDLNVNSYVSKPVELEQFTKTIQAVHQFWLGTALLPLTDHALSERIDSNWKNGEQSSNLKQPKCE